MLGKRIASQTIFPLLNFPHQKKQQERQNDMLIPSFNVFGVKRFSEKGPLMIICKKRSYPLEFQ